MASGENKVAYQSLISIDDEVSPELFSLFIMFNKLVGAHALQITPNRLEDQTSNQSHFFILAKIA